MHGYNGLMQIACFVCFLPSAFNAVCLRVTKFFMQVGFVVALCRAVCLLKFFNCALLPGIGNSLFGLVHISTLR